MTHSPFPWTLDNDGDLVDSTGALVLFTAPVRTDWPCQHAAANTALVEAIPAMMEALRFAATADVVDDGVIDRMQQMARAAIEKAIRS